jgi:hypothetical protein
MSAFVNQKEYENKSWTKECQGVTSDGRYWYISSNNEHEQGVNRFDIDMTHRKFFDLSGARCDHLGDIDYYNGRLYCAMEKPQRLVVLPVARFDHPDGGFLKAELKDHDGGDTPQGKSMPWCAMRPGEDLIYSSAFGTETNTVSTIYAYHRFDDGEYRHVPEKDISLDTAVARIQGGSFSENALLLSSYQ